jgi:hypothetical protein
MNEKCCIGLKLNSENDAWPVSLLALQGLPFFIWMFSDVEGQATKFCPWFIASTFHKIFSFTGDS